MKRLVSRVLAVACIAVSGVVLLIPAQGGAEAPQEIGWWSRQLPFQGDGDVSGQSVGDPVRFSSGPAQIPPVTTTPLPIPPPTIPPPPFTLPDSGEGVPNPSVPEGGLWVANDPTGPSAISALRFRGDIGTGELFLDVASGTTNIGPIVACPVLSDWTAGPAGAWRDRPAHDCDRLTLSARIAEDQSQVSFGIPANFVEFGERVLDIVLLPQPGAGDPFNVYFEAPDDSSFEVYSAQVPPPPDTTAAPIDEASLPTTAPTTAFVPPATASPVTVPSPATTEAPTVDLGGQPRAPQPVADVLDPLTESRAARIFAILVLFAMAGGLWWVGGQESRPPRLLGGLAANQAATVAIVDIVHVDHGRGIGRFRRERTSPPTRL